MSRGDHRRVLVIGCGNPLRCDDGAAWRVVQVIAHRWPDDVVIRLGQQLLPEWALDLSSVDVAFLVDASFTREVVISRVVPPRDSPLVDGHAVTPSDLVALARSLYGKSADVFVIEVPAADFQFGETLSPIAAEGAQAATRLLDAYILELTSTTGVL